MAKKYKIENKPKTPELVERWDLLATSMSDAEKIQESLETGYEPFSVTNQMKKVESSAISVPGQPPAGGMTMETIIWLKRRTWMPLTPEMSAPEPRRDD